MTEVGWQPPPELAGNPVLLELLRHPVLTEKYMPFSDYLKHDGLLPVRLRRIAILRTARNCGATYQWAAHAAHARRDGMHDAEIEQIAGPLDSGSWTAVERAVLSAVDELHGDHAITAATRAMLREQLDEAQLVELVMLVGNYEMIAMLTRTAGIEP